MEQAPGLYPGLFKRYILFPIFFSQVIFKSSDMKVKNVVRIKADSLLLNYLSLFLIGLVLLIRAVFKV